MINSQLGFFDSLILVFVIVFLFISYYKQKKIDENDLFFFLIFLIPYFFFTIIPLKNGLITTYLLIPTSFIMAKGILKSPKILKYIFLIVVVVGGLFYLTPIQGFKRTIRIDLGVPLWMQASPDYPAAIIKTPRINFFSKREDISLSFSKDSRFYALKDQQQIKEISKVIYNILATKNSTKVKTFFLYNNLYVYPNVLNYYLRLMNISSS